MRILATMSRELIDAGVWCLRCGAPVSRRRIENGSSHCSHRCYMRDYRGTVTHRTTPAAKRSDSWETRLLARRHINPETGCWEWTGATIAYGHGQIASHTEHWLVHRLAASLWLGFDPTSGLCVLHHCDNPPCFNPDHLFIGTRRDNVHDMLRKRRDRRNKGSANHRSKLTEDQVRAIRRCIGAGLSQSSIGAMFSISAAAIHSISVGRTWSHLP